MPRKRVNRSPPVEKRTDDADDDDFFFDDTQSNSGLLNFTFLTNIPSRIPTDHIFYAYLL